MHTANPGVESVPKSLPIMKVYDRLEAAFPGQPLSAVVMVKVDDTSTEPVRREIAALRRDAVASGQFHEPTQVDVNEHGTIAVVSLPITGSGTDAASNHALAQAAQHDHPEHGRHAPRSRRRRGG